MTKYVIISGCSYGEKGSVIDVEGELTDRQKVMLQPFEAPVVEVSVNADEIKEKAEAEAKVFLEKIHLKVVGKEPHHKAGLEKITDDILAAIEVE